MTNTAAIEQAMQDLRNAIRAEMIEQLREWWDDNRESYDSDPDGAIDDALITLEQLG